MHCPSTTAAGPMQAPSPTPATPTTSTTAAADWSSWLLTARCPSQQQLHENTQVNLILHTVTVLSFLNLRYPKNFTWSSLGEDNPHCFQACALNTSLWMFNSSRRQTIRLVLAYAWSVCHLLRLIKRCKRCVVSTVNTIPLDAIVLQKLSSQRSLLQAKRGERTTSSLSLTAYI